MSKEDKNEQTDADIEQSKADVLRAQDIIPGKGRTKHAPEAKLKKSDIPKFDLAEEIMAEQRKLAAVKRKAPATSNKTKAQLDFTSTTGKQNNQLAALSAKQDAIIAEIVSRDIEHLCNRRHL